MIDPPLVTTPAELSAEINQIRRLIEDNGVRTVPVFLLVLYPELAHLSPPPDTTLVETGPHFLMLRLT